MALRKLETPAFYARIEEKNLLRQYDLLTNCIEICLQKGIDAFDKYMLWSLNAAAVANICQHGGRYREQPIYVGKHVPPHFKDVDRLMDHFISVVHENWEIIDGPTELAAFALWRMNWIHPFIEGNGRTAEQRAICSFAYAKEKYWGDVKLCVSGSGKIVTGMLQLLKSQMKLGTVDIST